MEPLIDPKLAEWLRRMQEGGGIPAPEAPAAPVAAPEPVAKPPAPPVDDLAELRALDAKANEAATPGYLGQILSRSGAMIRGERVGALPAPPKVEDSVREFILRKKAQGPVDPNAAALAALNVELARKKLNEPPKAPDIGDQMPDEALASELTKYGLNPAAYKSRSEAQGALRAAYQAGTAAKARTAAELAADAKEEARKKEAEAKATAESTAKRYLGEYVTPAAMDLEPAQRNSITNELIVPGAQVVEKLADISGLLDAIGNAPSPQQLRDLHQLISGTMTKYNKVAGLGALSGPDQQLLERAIGSVDGLGGLLGNATGMLDLKRSIRNAAEIVSKEVATAAGSYGSKPKPGSVFDFSTWDARAKAAAESRRSTSQPKRPTRTLNGETREWDGKAWVLPGVKP